MCLKRHVAFFKGYNYHACYLTIRVIGYSYIIIAIMSHQFHLTELKMTENASIKKSKINVLFFMTIDYTRKPAMNLELSDQLLKSL